MSKKSILLTIVLVVISLPAFTNDTTNFYIRTLDINRSGMYLLGGWALANIATGTWGSLLSSGEQKYFHQMNAFWNIINAGIATYALFEIAGTDITGLSGSVMLQKHIRTENIFLINAGLDLLYMAGGFWMVKAAANNQKRPERLKGFGQSVMLWFPFPVRSYQILYSV